MDTDMDMDTLRIYIGRAGFAKQAEDKMPNLQTEKRAVFVRRSLNFTSTADTGYAEYPGGAWLFWWQ